MTVELAHQVHGNDGPPVVVLHGLLGSARNWATIGKRLGESHRVFALDLRNHGGSPWADAMTYEAMAEDVRTFIDARGLGSAAVIGHSMGGKVAMRLALAHADVVERLVVVDVAPVAYDHSFDEYIDAMRDADVDTAERRSDVEVALERTVPDPGVRAFLMQNLSRGPDGFVWRPNLDAIAIHMDDILGWPDSGARCYDGPALFVAGENSEYLRPEHHAEIRQLFPNGEFTTIDGAGHWVHAESPDAFLDVLRAFLR